MIQIKKATESNLSEILLVYEKARKFMKANGNPSQWAGGYPQESIIRADLAAERLYVCRDEDGIHGAFFFFIGDDPAYRMIEKGNWRCRQLPCGIIHRVASDGTLRGLSGKIFSFCRDQINYLRIDTHRDNAPMQHVLQKFGFQPCGIVHLKDGSERLAFDFIDSPSDDPC
jgi:hypothetical protein